MDLRLRTRFTHCFDTFWSSYVSLVWTPRFLVLRRCYVYRLLLLNIIYAVFDIPDRIRVQGSIFVVVCFATLERALACGVVVNRRKARNYANTYYRNCWDKEVNSKHQFTFLKHPMSFSFIILVYIPLGKQSLTSNGRVVCGACSSHLYESFLRLLVSRDIAKYSLLLTRQARVCHYHYLQHLGLNNVLACVFAFLRCFARSSKLLLSSRFWIAILLAQCFKVGVL